jgi:hypothetical protein
MADHWPDIFSPNCELTSVHVNNILNPFLHQLTAEERNYEYFQQGNATAHTADNSISAICEVFHNRIISKGLWPPRSLVVATFISGRT